MRRSFLAATALGSLIAFGSLGAQAPQSLPDPPSALTDLDRGVIGGRTAVSFRPRRPSSDESQAIDPAGYEVHLVPAADLDRELVYPADEWFQPSPGRYRVWLEGDGHISNGSFILSYSGGPGKRGLAGDSVVYPAGLVKLAPDLEVGSGIALRLLHTDSHGRGSFLKREMSRRVRGARLAEGVLMPEGEIVAALYDAEGEILALSRPSVVSRETPLLVAPRPPASGTDLLVVLDRPVPIDKTADDVVSIEARVDESAHPSDVLVTTADRVFAIWYGLEGRFAEVRATSPRLFMDPVTVPLRSGRTESHRAALRARPNLDVHLVMPPELDGEPISAEVFTLPHRQLVHQAEWTPGTELGRLEALPPAELRVVLRVGVWELAETVGLSDGLDGKVLFVPEPVVVEGTVYRGDEPHPATIHFLMGSERGLDVPTEPDGTYRAVLFESTHLALIELADSAGQPFAELLNPMIKESGRRDFHVPDNAWRVRVLDAGSREPVAGADVSTRNTTDDGTTSAQGSRTDSDGLAVLQPLRPGQAEVSAKADGYFPSETISRDVAEGDRGVEIEVMLEPVGEVARLRLLLPGGQPAAGSAVLARPRLDAGTSGWSGQADAQGVVAIPRQVAGTWLLIRHPAAGFLVRRFEDVSRPVSWTLPPLAPPLSVLVKDASGDPMPWAGLAVWVDDLRLSGSALSWLTEKTPASNSSGLWRATSFPAGPIEVLAWSISAREQARQGMLDSFAKPVAFPWPETVEVEAWGER